MPFERRIEWPGIATVVGLVSIGAFVYLATKDGFRLVDWQPLIAALVALTAALLAYKSAMAKVGTDERIRKEDLRRKRLGLYLRTEHMCEILRFRADSLVDKTKPNFLNNGTVIDLYDLKLVAAPEIDEVWANLELFPADAAITISSIQSCLRTLRDFIETREPDTIWKIEESLPYSAQMKITNDIACDIRQACSELLANIRPVVRTLSDEVHSI
jgi:hypothetical protein